MTRRKPIARICDAGSQLLEPGPLRETLMRGYAYEGERNDRAEALHGHRGYIRQSMDRVCSNDVVQSSGSVARSGTGSSDGVGMTKKELGVKGQD
jgi:hypothetical protein